MSVSAYLAVGIMVDCGRCFAGRDFHAIYCMNGGFERVPDICQRGYLLAEDLFLQDNLFTTIEDRDIAKFQGLKWINLGEQRTQKCVRSSISNTNIVIEGMCEEAPLLTETTDKTLPAPLLTETADKTLPAPLPPNQLNLTLELLAKLDIEGTNQSDFILDIIKEKIKEKVNDELVEILTPISSVTLLLACCVYIYFYCKRLRVRGTMNVNIADEEVGIVDTVNNSLSQDSLSPLRENEAGTEAASESATAAALAGVVLGLATATPNYRVNEQGAPPSSPIEEVQLVVNSPLTPPSSEIDLNAQSPSVIGSENEDEEVEEFVQTRRPVLHRSVKSKKNVDVN